jgi:hypothetical protein
MVETHWQSFGQWVVPVKTYGVDSSDKSFRFFFVYKSSGYRTTDQTVIYAYLPATYKAEIGY